LVKTIKDLLIFQKLNIYSLSISVNLRIGTVSEQLVGLSNKGLSQFETQDCGIKPVKSRTSVLCLLDESIKKFILTSGFISENEFFPSLIQNQLSYRFFH